MHCPYLKHDSVCCLAVEPFFTIGSFELEEYCTNERHRSCRLFQQRRAEARRLRRAIKREVARAIG